jgi:hypothetical protein
MSDSDNWRTPEWLFKELDEEFHFELDLCATYENRKCGWHCENYLNTDLTEGNVDCAFMNPPYSNPKPFIEKAWEDSKHCKIVCLVKCDPSTKWWATIWDYGNNTVCTICNNTGVYLDNFSNEWQCRGHDYARRGPKPGCEVRFFPKRIKFDPPKGFEGKTTGPSFSSALVIMDRRTVCGE